MSLEFSLALRYLRGNRHTLGGWLTSFIAMAGITVGVAALIATLSVMTGFREEIRQKILTAQPHLIITGNGRYLPVGDWSYLFDNVPSIQAWSPFIMNKVLAKNGSLTRDILIKGVDPEKEKAITNVERIVTVGDWDKLSDLEAKEPPIFLGKELARHLRLAVGEKFLISVPSFQLGMMMEIPPLFTVRVAGIIETGLYHIDDEMAFMSLTLAQKVFSMTKDYTGIGVRINNPDEPIEPMMRIRHNAGSAVHVRSWLHMNRNLFAALKLEKVVMFMILTLITLVAAFTVVSNLILVTAQKTREIGILKAMGATSLSIRKIFLYKGLFMGLIGVGMGTLLGLFISWILGKYQFLQLPADVYYVETLPVRIVPGDVGLVVVAAFIIVLLATLYPAHLAARLNALKAIRHE